MEHDKPFQESWTPGRCNETSGFLFRHQCGEMPLRQCIRCGKPLCEKHAYEGTEGTLCAGCFKQQPRSPNDMAPNDMTPDQASPGNEPYFSGDQYYRGYGHYGPGFWGSAWLASHGTHHHHHHRQHDPNDFTEADAESLTNLGDEDFESDMSES